MGNKVNIDQITQDIILSLEDAGIVGPENLQQAKLVLDMHLSKYDITAEETALSTELDQTPVYLERFLLDMRPPASTWKGISSHGRMIIRPCL